jgi:hypothetical protein
MASAVHNHYTDAHNQHLLRIFRLKLKAHLCRTGHEFSAHVLLTFATRQKLSPYLSIKSKVPTPEERLATRTFQHNLSHASLLCWRVLCKCDALLNLRLQLRQHGLKFCLLKVIQGPQAIHLENIVQSRTKKLQVRLIQDQK